MKVLVDSSIWIDHFHKSKSELVEALLERKVWTHTAVMGELICGSLTRRKEVISELKRLPRLGEAEFEETLLFVELHHLWNRGLSWVDAQILAASSLSDAVIWTQERRLRLVAQELGLAYDLG